MQIQAGSRLGPYEILSPLGAGGMGEVYRARDTRLGREVAIKVLPHELSADRERLARFSREARSSSALNHRNIVTIHDFTSEDGVAWLVMELIRGQSLRELLEQGPVPMKQLLPIATGIADGLAAAHGAGIIHRDLKPENVMLASDGTPKICDFGLVKQVTGDTSAPTDAHMTSAGTVMGTATYMSPEQARGEEVDFRSDHFSFGLMLQEMATGRHPFGRATAAETLAGILNAEPAPLDDSFPEPFIAIVERCLEKKPADRYGSTTDLAHDLARLRERSGRQTVSTTIPQRQPRWGAIAFAALGAVVLALLAFSILRSKKPAPAPDPIHTTVATPEITNVFLGETSNPVALSPDGRYLAVYGATRDGTPALSLHDLRTGSSRILAQNAYSPAWSSDSRSIAYFAEGKLKTIGIDGGPPRIICDARPESTPTWVGDTILFGQYSKDPGIHRVNSAGGTSELLVRAEFGKLVPFFPHFLPDGKRFLYVTIVPALERREIAHEVVLASLDGGAPKKIGTMDSRAVFVDGHLLFVRDGTLLAQPFDPDTAQLSGEAKPIVDGLHYFRGTGGAAFSVSQNGTLAWREARRTLRLAWVDRSGLELESIGSATFSGPGRLSPDGTRYAAGIVENKQGLGDLWIYDLGRGSSERLTYRLFDEMAPVWTRDGRALYYRSDGAGGPPDILLWRLGTDDGVPLFRGRGVEEPQDVSPDGKWLLFVDKFAVGAASRINLLPLAPPGPPRPLSSTPFNEASPRFSPDGRWIAYQSDASGRFDVYVRPFEGSALPTRISKDGGTHPRWRADGKELFYLSQDDRLMAVAMSGGAITGNPRMLFHATDAIEFETAPDGSRFLMQLAERPGDPTVHLLINWPARLRPQN